VADRLAATINEHDVAQDAALGHKGNEEVLGEVTTCIDHYGLDRREHPAIALQPQADPRGPVSHDAAHHRELLGGSQQRQGDRLQGAKIGAGRIDVVVLEDRDDLPLVVGQLLAADDQLPAVTRPGSLCDDASPSLSASGEAAIW
jgi:hypothetical protein